MTGHLPNFVIAGTMKSGTTSVAEWIGAHPQGYVPARKEIHFFDVEDHWRRGSAWYAETFAEAGDADAVGDATPLYMYFPEAVERMARVLPDARVVVCLRNPIDRAYSHYLHYFQRAARESRSFAQAVDDELAGDVFAPPDLHDFARAVERYLAQGLYLRQLEHLTRFYARDRIHVVLLEDLADAPRQTYRDLCGFLAIDASVVPPNVGVAANAHIEFRPVWLWRRLLAAGVIERLPRATTERFVGRFMMREAVPYDPVSGDVRARLNAFFAPENAALGAWLGRDLSAWR